MKKAWYCLFNLIVIAGPEEEDEEEEEEEEDNEDVTYEGDALQDQRVLDVDDMDDVIIQQRRRIVSEFYWDSIVLNVSVTMHVYIWSNICTCICIWLSRLRLPVYLCLVSMLMSIYVSAFVYVCLFPVCITF